MRAEIVPCNCGRKECFRARVDGVGLPITTPTNIVGSLLGLARAMRWNWLAEDELANNMVPTRVEVWK